MERRARHLYARFNKEPQTPGEYVQSRIVERPLEIHDSPFYGQALTVSLETGIAGGDTARDTQRLIGRFMHVQLAGQP